MMQVQQHSIIQYSITYTQVEPNKQRMAKLYFWHYSVAAGLLCNLCIEYFWIFGYERGKSLRILVSLLHFSQNCQNFLQFHFHAPHWYSQTICQCCRRVQQKCNKGYNFDLPRVPSSAPVRRQLGECQQSAQYMAYLTELSVSMSVHILVSVRLWNFKVGGS